MAVELLPQSDVVGEKLNKSFLDTPNTTIPVQRVKNGESPRKSLMHLYSYKYPY